MSEWPHAPPHRSVTSGTYMVTGSTLRKEHHFRDPDRLHHLRSTLLPTLEEFGWRIQAWSIFSNHYHFVASNTESPESLPAALQKVHSITSIAMNALDSTPGRQVWYEFWDTLLTYEKSYLARLSYVMTNPVRHGLVRDATSYPWCSAAWFEDVCPRSFVKTVQSFKTDRLKVRDDFDPILDED